MKKIFIIEDDTDISAILSIALGSRYLLVMMNDTKNLMERMNEFLPDLIITDNFVGQKVAAEIIKEIRKEPHFSSIPVMLFSGHPDVEILSREIAASAFLSKPFSLQQLNACIETVLTISPAEKEFQGNKLA